jgi:putative transport protein
MLHAAIELLIAYPLLLLFVVASLGYPLGKLRFAGTSLGVAAVLFVGLAIGALDPALKLPAIISELGLVIFVYTIGLSSGPGFFAALRRKGLRDNALVLGVLLVAAALTLGFALAFDLSPAVAAGLFAGSLTNTPALAGVIERIRAGAPAELAEQLAAEPVVGYSVAYPLGVVGVLLTITLFQRLWKIDYAAELRQVREPGIAQGLLENRTIVVTRSDIGAQPLFALVQAQGWDVIVGRYRHQGQTRLADTSTYLAPGDLVSLIGSPEEVERAMHHLGEASREQLELDRSRLDYRRIFVSSPKVAGRKLGELNLPQLFGAVVTRVRRGDIELLPHGDTVLELGDRVRVVAPRANMQAVTRFFGDSYKALSEIDVMSFSLGITLGILVGLIPIPLPGGLTLRLGFAGGPLLVALLLGKLERTGPVVWTLPYSANLLLRQTGLVLFLAAVGTRSGYAFVQTLAGGGGLPIFLAGALITCLSAALTLLVGYKLLRIPMGLLTGIVAGVGTQPAVLSFANEQSQNDLPNVGYATVVPVAMIGKIVLAQLLLIVLQRL